MVCYDESELPPIFTFVLYFRLASNTGAASCSLRHIKSVAEPRLVENMNPRTRLLEAGRRREEYWRRGSLRSARE